MTDDLPDQSDTQPQPNVLEFTPEERAEFEAWEKLSDEAWALFLRWEAEEAARGEMPQQPEHP